MSGIAGMERTGARADVEKMLSRIGHRGPAGPEIIETGTMTLGLVFSAGETEAVEDLRKRNILRDGEGYSRLAEACTAGDRMTLTRDALGGFAPLYYGRLADGTLCFASEVKALLPLTDRIQEFLPGTSTMAYRYGRTFGWRSSHPLLTSPSRMAQDLRGHLAAAVERRLGNGEVGNGEVGCWLSGGLDSSAMAALARPHVDRLHTFAAGLAGAPDLGYAAEVAAFIDSDHHEVVVTFDQMLASLPAVIYHLESFDALLVRSSITNYLVAKAASDYVPAVFSGEGGDELFAGYAYLRALDPALLPAELIDIIGRLHNTALQRVDRCASAHGTVADVAFLNPDVVAYALQVPAEFKLRDGIEKWVLRRAMDGALPERVLKRTKSKFWEGAGVGDLLARYADAQITDADFRRERRLSNGWILNSKEEMLYYRIFREWFGTLADLLWMGRSKGVPQAPA